MKLIINFSTGQYSPIKEKFKSLFAGKLKWDGKQGWIKGSNYIRATEKMLTGAPVSFVCEIDEELKEKLSTFSKDHSINYNIVESFDNVKIIEAPPEYTFINVKIDRVKSFFDECSIRKDLSASFIEGWGKLLKEDDIRINKGE